MIIENWVNTLPWHKIRRWSKRRIAEIDKIVIHQTLSVGSIEAINKYHITPSSHNHLSPRGAPHIAYHYLIDRAGTNGVDGRIICANNPDDVVWHTKGQNRVGLGISVCGNFIGEGWDDGDKGPSESQMKALEQLVEILQRNFNIPNTKVYGHYHFGKPACPGTAIKRWIERHRSPGRDIVGDLELRDKASAIYSELRKMMSRDRIKFYQKALNTVGFNVGKADGIIGTRTSSGIRVFQRDNRLNMDGIMGPVSTHRLISNVLKMGKDVTPTNLKQIIAKRGNSIQ